MGTKEINGAILALREYQKMHKVEDVDEESFLELCHFICCAFLKWLGDTYVGQRKEPDIEKLYQDFFVEIYNLINTLNLDPTSNLSLENELIDKISYTGTLYRFLGSAIPGNTVPVCPEYNEIYVSWSKEPKNSYLRSKLYGPVTQLSCKVKSPYWGIDIEGFTDFYHKYINSNILIARANEREVVFPTIENCITSIRYIPEEADE